jgi:hypothetical protein
VGVDRLKATNKEIEAKRRSCYSVGLLRIMNAVRLATQRISPPPPALIAKSSPLTTTLGSARTFKTGITAAVAARYAAGASARRVARGAGKRLLRKSIARKNATATPALDQVGDLCLTTRDMDNDMLVTLGALGHHESRKEIVRRHIMNVDRVSYEEACETFKKIEEKNREKMWLLALPYHVGIGVALSAAVCALPMVFDYPTAEWFNLHYVTTDVPEPKDLETMLEVGAWTWNWMEPPLGTISFVLLALQFSRSQLQNLGIKPYTERIKKWRGRRLVEEFPSYEPSVLISYSETSTIHKTVFL